MKKHSKGISGQTSMGLTFSFTMFEPILNIHIEFSILYHMKM